MKVRTTASPLVDDLFVAMGAQPKTMAFADAQGLLFNAGTLDAQEGTAAAFAAARLDALGIRQVVLWGAIDEVAVFAVNRVAWTGLTDDERVIVREAAQQAADELPALARAEKTRRSRSLRKRGVTVTRLTARAAPPLRPRRAGLRQMGRGGGRRPGACRGGVDRGRSAVSPAFTLDHRGRQVHEAPEAHRGLALSSGGASA